MGAKQIERLNRDPKIIKLYSDADNLYTKSLEMKRRFARQWFVNLSYLLGHQWLGFGSNGQIYDLLNQRFSADGRIRMVENQVIINVFKMVARILRSDPILDVVPNSTDPEDYFKARGSQKFLRYLWETLDFKGEILPRLILDVCTYGTGFLKVYWDKDAGEDIYLPKMTKKDITVTTEDENGESVPVIGDDGEYMSESRYIEEYDENGEPITEAIRTGEVAVDVIPPFDMHVNPECQNWDEAEKIVQQKERSVEYVEEKYDIKLAADADETKAGSGYENRIRRLLFSESEYETYERKSVVIKEYYEKPSKKYPKGRFAIMGGGKVLEYDEKYPYGEIPYTPFWFFKINNRVWGEPLTSHLIAPQKQLNVVLSKLVSNTKLMSNPKWLVPKGSGMKNSALTEREGEVIEYEPNLTGVKPEQITASPIPNYVEGLYTKLKQGIMDIASQHEVSQGRVPPGVEAASAIMALQESDDLVISTVIKGIERSYEKTGSMLLRRARDFYNENRQVKIIGKNNELDEVFMFSKSDLESSDDVKVRSASGLPVSKSGKMQVVFDLVNRGILDPKAHQKLILHLIDIPEIDAELGVNDNHAKLEDMMMQSGQQMPVTDWQNDEIHLTIHNDFMNSQIYMKLDPKIQQVFMQHREMHKQNIVKKGIEMNQLQGMMQSGGVPAPGPVVPGGMPPQQSEGMPPEGGEMIA